MGKVWHRVCDPLLGGLVTFKGAKRSVGQAWVDMDLHFTDPALGGWVSLKSGEGGRWGKCGANRVNVDLSPHRPCAWGLNDFPMQVPSAA